MPLSPSRFLLLATLVLLPLAGEQAADYVVRSEDPNVLYGIYRNGRQQIHIFFRISPSPKLGLFWVFQT